MHLQSSTAYIWAGLFRGCALLALASLLSCAVLAQEEVLSSLRISVQGKDQKPVSGATIAIKAKGATLRSLKTNEKGEADASNLPRAPFQLDVSKGGFQPVSRQIVPEKGESSLEVEVALVPKIENRETMEVQAADTLEKGPSSSQDLGRQQAKSTPQHPGTVADALPLLAGVVRGPEGLSIAGAGEKHTALLVNSVDTTDPATGEFGLTVPVDAVENLNVAETPYLAHYGGFTGGVVAAATRGGGEKWNFELNDPFPEFRIRSLHMQGLRSVSPHVNLGGPLLAQKLYFSEALEVVDDKTPVLVQPFPFNETKTISANSFSQMDLVLSPTHTLTGTFHIAPQTVNFVGLNFFNPQPVTPNLDLRSGVLATTDRLALRGGILQSTIAAEDFRLGVGAQGTAEMVITPVGNQGNYFSGQSRQSSRLEWIENYSLKPFRLAGTHNLQFGTLAAHSEDTGSFFARPVSIDDAHGNLLKQIDFVGGRPFSRSDKELAVFGEDHWALNTGLSVDAGVRVEQQGVTGTRRLAPRTGFVWVPPLGNKKTSIRGGAGVFYDRVPLDVYAFQSYPRQVVTTFDPLGNIISGPVAFFNVIMPSDRKWAGIHRRNRAGNFAPYSAGGNLEVEQAVAPILKVSARFNMRNSNGLVTVSPAVLKTGQSALIERDSGSAQYRELTFTATVGKETGRRIFFTYTHSSTRGDLNESGDYVGNLPFPVVRPNFFSFLPGDVPNRFLVWGESNLPWKMRVIPMVEYRTGFPYFVTDAYQNFVGTPNTTRFPGYLSVDARLAKDFAVTSKYTARVSVRGLDLTNHFNPLAVRSNIADPLFGDFFGNYGRRFRLDFDVLF
ncbi:MAG TPA: carboxypeptidase regulatory-like domain-containing protein [Candidatus Angelobacter sp.]|nr:carboxypeptidase regulatory-like domain-containing protein [Candidatus Angelobacter sp.]